jgi:hypothetical protein
MIIDNDMRSSSTLSTVLRKSFMIIQTVSFPMSDILCLKFAHFKNVMIVLDCNYINGVGEMLTVQKTSTNNSLGAQNFWFINDNNQFWEILDVLWQDVMFFVYIQPAKVCEMEEIIRSMTSDSSNIDFFISHCMI